LFTWQLTDLVLHTTHLAEDAVVDVIVGDHDALGVACATRRVLTRQSYSIGYVMLVTSHNTLIKFVTSY
jgi:hypothetical protein